MEKEAKVHVLFVVVKIVRTVTSCVLVSDQNQKRSKPILLITNYVVKEAIPLQHVEVYAMLGVDAVPVLVKVVLIG